MNQMFQGWAVVADHLQQQADVQDQLAHEKGEEATHLNPGQRASLRAVLEHITIDQLVKGELPPEIAHLVADPDAWVAH